jgi:recombinational DNA repair protein (RecF pathway)
MKQLKQTTSKTQKLSCSECGKQYRRRGMKLLDSKLLCHNCWSYKHHVSLGGSMVRKELLTKKLPSKKEVLRLIRLDWDKEDSFWELLEKDNNKEKDINSNNITNSYDPNNEIP